MGKVYDRIDPELADWIARQHLFFVATAPSLPDGHINLSPRGGDSFRVLGPGEVAWQDYTGSGAETVAHLRDNGRIVVLFCAFDGPPKIVRLHGQGTVIFPGQPEYESLEARFPANPGTRAFIRISVQRVSDSCGYAVPFYDYQGPRETLDRWAVKQGPQKLAEYRATKNRLSIDGLPAFDVNR